MPHDVDGGVTLAARTMGAAWLAAARRILEAGTVGRYDDLPIRELALLTLTVDRPDPDDEIISQLGDPERLGWMRANFTSRTAVAELGGADSYATRLFDYEHSGRDQIAWVIDRLRRDPASRSATITTFQPRTDTVYIPCVCMLDFWLPGGGVELVVYAHSIDFGAKGYANLIELAALQQYVARELERPVGRLVMIIKSAHAYDADLGYLRRVIDADELVGHPISHRPCPRMNH